MLKLQLVAGSFFLLYTPSLPLPVFDGIWSPGFLDTRTTFSTPPFLLFAAVAELPAHPPSYDRGQANSKTLPAKNLVCLCHTWPISHTPSQVLSRPASDTDTVTLTFALSTEHSFLLTRKNTHSHEPFSRPRSLQWILLTQLRWTYRRTRRH